MLYLVKWLGTDGKIGQSDLLRSPSEAITYSRQLARLRPARVWAESESGLRFELAAAAAAGTTVAAAR